MESITVRRALISVSDKTGIVDFARALSARGVEIISTGGTAKALADAGVPVIGISDVTGFPEMLEGRVKTLHPKVHGGILADRDKGEHMETIAAHGIAPIDLVCVNLYPFAQTVAKPGVTLEDAIENIDIGGPSMVRSAAKNHGGVAIVVDPLDYAVVLAELESAGGTLSLTTRQRLAAKAFAQTAAYDAGIADYLEKVYAPPAQAHETPLPATLRLSYPRAQVLRYGENPHQKAAFYREPNVTEPCVGNAIRRDHSGKEVSFNNLYDLDGALELVKEFPEAPTAAIIKHANPCGIAVARGAGDPIASAHARAQACDPVSAYGGVIAANRTITLAAAESIKDIFTEVVVAPAFEPAALELLRTKKNLRVLTLPDGYHRGLFEVRQVSGGVLVQTADSYVDFSSAGWSLVAGPEADATTMADLEFAWRAVRAVKSNAILLADDGASVGVGMGQVNRVDSCLLAVTRAGERAEGSVAASDAFFPFADGAEILIRAGVRAIVQPGGSIRDDDVIRAAQDAGVTMYFTGERHFAH